MIVTHAADFGRLMHVSSDTNTGIVFLRPGHIDYKMVIQTLQSILAAELEAQLPFMLVAERIGDDVKIRLRLL